MRFQVGDIVRIVVVTDPKDFDVLFEEGTITEASPKGCLCYEDGLFYDYVVDTDHEDWVYLADDFQLQPLTPPVEPISLTRREECEA